MELGDWAQLDQRTKWLKGGPAYSPTSCPKLDGKNFEEYVFLARDDRFHLKTALRVWKHQRDELDLSSDEDSPDDEDTTAAFSWSARTHKVLLLWFHQIPDIYNTRSALYTKKMERILKKEPPKTKYRTDFSGSDISKYIKNKDDELMIQKLGVNWSCPYMPRKGLTKRQQENQAKLEVASAEW